MDDRVSEEDVPEASHYSKSQEPFEDVFVKSETLFDGNPLFQSFVVISLSVENPPANCLPVEEGAPRVRNLWEPVG